MELKDLGSSHQRALFIRFIYSLTRLENNFLTCFPEGRTHYTIDHVLTAISPKSALCLSFYIDVCKKTWKMVRSKTLNNSEMEVLL